MNSITPVCSSYEYKFKTEQNSPTTLSYQTVFPFFIYKSNVYQSYVIITFSFPNWTVRLWSSKKYTRNVSILPYKHSIKWSRCLSKELKVFVFISQTVRPRLFCRDKQFMMNQGLFGQSLLGFSSCPSTVALRFGLHDLFLGPQPSRSAPVLDKLWVGRQQE